MKTILLITLISFNLLAMPTECEGMQDQFQTEISKFHARKLKDISIFVGSSSIRMWKNIHQYFSELYQNTNSQNYYNRGFGGSQICHLIINYQKLFIGESKKQMPKRIIIYSGDNDLGTLSADKIVEHYQILIELIREKNKVSPIFIIATKPSFHRISQLDEIQRIGNLLEKNLNNKNGVKIINTYPAFFDDAGRLKEEYFLSDGLHLKPVVYEIWAKELEKLW